MIRRPPRSTQSRSSAASDVYKRQLCDCPISGGCKTHRKHLDVESEMPGAGLCLLLFCREKIQKQSRKTGILEFPCYCPISPAEPAAAAPMGEEHNAFGIG